MSESNGPIEVLYFYRTRWGGHDEFVGSGPAQPGSHLDWPHASRHRARDPMGR